MNQQQQDDLIEQQAGLIESQADIIEALRVILLQEGDARQTLAEARIALSDWFIATYPHLYPSQGRPQLRLIRGPYPHLYLADRLCPECALLVPAEVVVQEPKTIGYRCGQGHKWLAGLQNRRPAG